MNDPSVPGPGNILEAVGITKRYGAQAVVDDVSLAVRRGETICLLGPSGAGKSTFLRCLNMLEPIDDGYVLLDGQMLGFRPHRGKLRELSNRGEARQRQQIGMVFQQFNLFPHMSVLANVTEAPIGVLIVGFGLWEAWKLSRGIPIRIEGPYRVAPSTGPPVA